MTWISNDPPKIKRGRPVMLESRCTAGGLPGIKILQHKTVPEETTIRQLLDWAESVQNESVACTITIPCGETIRGTNT